MSGSAGAKVVEVIAYCGYSADERPLYFILDERRLEVEVVLERWRDQRGDYFKVETKDKSEFVLKRDRSSDIWSLINE